VYIKAARGGWRSDDSRWCTCSCIVVYIYTYLYLLRAHLEVSMCIPRLPGVAGDLTTAGGVYVVV